MRNMQNFIGIQEKLQLRAFKLPFLVKQSRELQENIGASDVTRGSDCEKREKIQLEHKE